MSVSRKQNRKKEASGQVWAGKGVGVIIFIKIWADMGDKGRKGHPGGKSRENETGRAGELQKGSKENGTREKGKQMKRG